MLHSTWGVLKTSPLPGKLFWENERCWVADKLDPELLSPCCSDAICVAPVRTISASSKRVLTMPIRILVDCAEESGTLNLRCCLEQISANDLAGASFPSLPLTGGSHLRSLMTSEVTRLPSSSTRFNLVTYQLFRSAVVDLTEHWDCADSRRRNDLASGVPPQPDPLLHAEVQPNRHPSQVNIFSHAVHLCRGDSIVSVLCTTIVLRSTQYRTHRPSSKKHLTEHPSGKFNFSRV